MNIEAINIMITIVPPLNPFPGFESGPGPGPGPGPSKKNEYY